MQKAFSIAEGFLFVGVNGQISNRYLKDLIDIQRLKHLIS